MKINREFDIRDIIDENEIGKLDINVVLAQNRIVDIIDSIYEQAFTIKENENRICKTKDVGFYIKLNKVSSKKMYSLHSIFKLFYLAEKKARTVMLGDTNMSDWEGQQSYSRLYILESLRDIFYSRRNEKLDEDLRIYDIDDIKNILRDADKSRRIVNYILIEVEMRLKTLIRKANPDFNYNCSSKKFEPIRYKYLDAPLKNNDTNDNDVDPYAILGECIEDNSYSGLCKHIISNYFHLLTSKQKIFIGCLLVFSAAENGNIYNFNNELLYTRQQAYQFTVQIRKRLIKEIEDDLEIKENEYGRWVLKN